MQINVSKIFRFQLEKFFLLATFFYLSSLILYADPPQSSWYAASYWGNNNNVITLDFNKDTNAVSASIKGSNEGKWLAFGTSNIKIIPSDNAFLISLKSNVSEQNFKVTLFTPGGQRFNYSIPIRLRDQKRSDIYLDFNEFIDFDNHQRFNSRIPAHKFQFTLSGSWQKCDISIFSISALKKSEKLSSFFQEYQKSFTDNEFEIKKDIESKGFKRLPIEIYTCHSALPKRFKLLTNKNKNRNNPVGLTFKPSKPFSYQMTIPSLETANLKQIVLYFQKNCSLNLEIFKASRDKENIKVYEGKGWGKTISFCLNGEKGNNFILKFTPLGEAKGFYPLDLHVLSNLLLEIEAYGEVPEEVQIIKDSDIICEYPKKINGTKPEKLYFEMKPSIKTSDLTLEINNWNIFGDKKKLGVYKLDPKDHKLETSIKKKDIFQGINALDAALKKEGTLIKRIIIPIQSPLQENPTGKEAQYEPNKITVYFPLPIGPKKILPLMKTWRGYGDNMRYLDLTTGWDQLEPYWDGTYSLGWHKFYLDNALENKMLANIKIWYAENYMYKYLSSSMLDQEGRRPQIRLTITKGGVVPSTYAKNFREDYRKLIKAFVEQFDSHPALTEYSFCSGAVETEMPEYLYPSKRDTNIEHFRDPRIYDYSEYSRLAFINYLREVKKYSISDLNKRYNTDWKNWEDLALPQYTGFNVPDLRAWWTDFIDFRIHGIVEWHDYIFSCVERYSKLNKKKSLFALGAFGAIDYICLNAKKHNALILSGTSEVKHAPILHALIRRCNIEYRPETGMTMPPPFKFFSGIYNLLNWSSNFSFNYVGYKNNIKREGGNFPYLQKLSMLIKDWKKGYNKGPYAAGLFSLYTQLHIGKKFTNCGMKYPYSLLDAMNKEHCFLDFIGDQLNYEVLENDPGLRLLIDLDSSVITNKLLKSIKAFVNKGGTLILGPDSFRWIREDYGKNEYKALRELGFDGSLKANDNIYRKKTLYAALPWKSLLPECKTIYGEKALKDIKIKSSNLLANSKDGYPIAVSWNFGKGQIILFLVNVDWQKSTGLLSAIYKEFGIPKRVKADNPHIKIGRKDFPDDIIYIFAQNPNPTKDIACKISLPDIELNASYEIEDVFSEKFQNLTGLELRNGMEICLKGGFMNIYKIGKIKPLIKAFPQNQGGK